MWCTQPSPGRVVVIIIECGTLIAYLIGVFSDICFPFLLHQAVIITSLKNLCPLKGAFHHTLVPSCRSTTVCCRSALVAASFLASQTTWSLNCHSLTHHDLSIMQVLHFIEVRRPHPYSVYEVLGLAFVRTAISTPPSPPSPPVRGGPHRLYCTVVSFIELHCHE